MYEEKIVLVLCKYVHMWRPEDSLQCCYRGAIHLVFKGALSLTWNSPSGLACRPLESTSSSGITSAQHWHGLKGSNSGPHVCKTSILPTEPLKGELMETKTNHKRDWEAYNTAGILRNPEMNRKSLISKQEETSSDREDKQQEGQSTKLHNSTLIVITLLFWFKGKFFWLDF